MVGRWYTWWVDVTVYVLLYAADAMLAKIVKDALLTAEVATTSSK